MPRLVAIDAVPGPSFVEALLGAWDRGDAVVPIDPRLPPPARTALREDLRVGEPVETGDALVVATSGTTGQPKGVVLTHEAIEASARATSRRLDVDPGTDAWLARLPLAHVGGLAVVTRALSTRTALTFDPHDERATLTAVVPTVLEREPLDRFRVVLVGGAADWRSRAPNVVHTYGMTETGSGVVYDGRPLDGVEVRVDGDGQLHVRGPMLLRAYRDGVDPKDGDGWLATGDAGAVEADGRVVVRGRVAEVIVTGGEKVWPAAVEAVLRTHPGVADVAVAGRPDPEWGSVVVAFVEPAGAERPPTLAGLRSHAKEHLPAYAAPRRLVLVDALPRNRGGKIDRRNLPTSVSTEVGQG